MKTHRILRGLKVLLFVLLAATVFSFAVMWLWNWLMPAIFGLHAISFWQALGLLVLSKILFGGFRGRPGFGGRLAPAHDRALGTDDSRKNGRNSGPACAVAAARLVPRLPRPPLPRRRSSGERGRSLGEHERFQNGRHCDACIAGEREASVNQQGYRTNQCCCQVDRRILTSALRTPWPPAVQLVTSF